MLGTGPARRENVKQVYSNDQPCGVPQASLSVSEDLVGIVDADPARLIQDLRVLALSKHPSRDELETDSCWYLREARQEKTDPNCPHL